MRLFGLLHLLGQASLRMEQALWPEDYERMTRKVKGVQREAEGDNAKSYIYEEFMQIRQECSGLLIPDTDLGENPRRERGV